MFPSFIEKNFLSIVQEYVLYRKPQSVKTLIYHFKFLFKPWKAFLNEHENIAIRDLAFKYDT